MATLHSLQHSFDVHSWLDRCLESVGQDDGIILLENAVTISCLTPVINRITNLEIQPNLYVIDVDLKARGLLDQYDHCFLPVSYQEFVELTLRYDKLINWA